MYGDDYLLQHRANEKTEEDSGEETSEEDDTNETLNTTKACGESDSTLYYILMDWDALPEEPFYIGYGEGNKAAFENDYCKSFLEGKDLTYELEIVTGDKFICTIGKFHQLIEVCWCKVCGKQRKVIKHRFVGSVLEVNM